MRAFQREYETDVTFILDGFRWTHLFDSQCRKFSIVTNRATSPETFRRHSGDALSPITVWQYFRRTGWRGAAFALFDFLGLYRCARPQLVRDHWQGDEHENLKIEEWDTPNADSLTQVCDNARARHSQQPTERLASGNSPWDC